MIRPAMLAIGVFLVLGLAVVLIWPFLLIIFQSPVPPGQYPLADPRPEWPASQRVRPYRPGPGMGSDTVVSADVTGPKVACALKTATC